MNEILEWMLIIFGAGITYGALGMLIVIKYKEHRK